MIAKPAFSSSHLLTLQTGNNEPYRKVGSFLHRFLLRTPAPYLMPRIVVYEALLDGSIRCRSLIGSFFGIGTIVSTNRDNVLASPWFIEALYRLVRAYAWSFRLRIENEQVWMRYVEKGGTVLLCAWHQQFFSAIRHFRQYRRFGPHIMISRSRDGELIAGVARRTGWHPVRGSSSRGGREAMRGVIDELKKSRLAGHIVDGPRGPAGKVKAGVIRMAHAAGAAVVPFYISADKAWYFNSWDRFMLPKPFSRVTLRFDRMVHLDADVDEAGFEIQRHALERMMRPCLIK